MGWLRGLWASLLIGGCAHSAADQTTTYDAFGNELASRAQQETREKLQSSAPLVQRYGGLTFAPLCDGKRSAPGTHQGELEGIAFEQPCGTIFQGFTDQQFPSFAAVHCLAVADDRCRSAARRMFVARLNERYKLANRGWIDGHCGAHADECNQPQELEALYATSHNAAALAELARALKLADAAPERRVAAQRQVFLSYFSEAEQPAR